MPLHSFCSVLQSICKIPEAVQFIFKIIHPKQEALHGKIKEEKEKANP